MEAVEVSARVQYPSAGSVDDREVFGCTVSMWEILIDI
jgi:hypothetical protein